MKTYSVEVAQAAQDDLERLYTFLADHDVRTADHALAAIEKSYAFLETFADSCRKVSTTQSGLVQRELIVPFGKSGYLLLFEVSAPGVVTVLAVRHQRESDYH